jgi:hypothetical protein
MGGPPMGGPPMGGPPRAAPVRRGTSKAVPLVVSAGLAVGVFCGLLFGVGKKSEAVAAGPTTTEKDDKAKAAPAQEPAKPQTPAPPAAGSAVAAAGSAAPTVPPTPPPVTVPKTIKLTVTVKPEGAAKDAKLIIDGQAVEGMTTELPFDKKSVKVEIKASGYRSVDKKIDLAGGDTAVEFEMAKRTGGTGTPAVRPPKRPDRPPSGGGGLIDI